MSKKILIPLDGSPLAEAVLPHAQAVAKAENAEIVILRVPVVPAAEFFGRNTALASMVSHDLDEEANQYVQAEVRMLRNGGATATGMIREGPVPETIIKVADEIHADMIAMSTHGYTGLKHWFKGSMAEDVVHHTHIPVMLIHPN
ncbi:MAG TPA: universal stress protein [Anaerolineales bacterium]|nr:universal stress protein [Anaerolineales bacterium]